MSEISHPCVMRSMVEIVGVVIMCVGFAFEGNPSISISFSPQAYQPLNEIPYIKEHKGCFSHLSRVDTLMTHNACSDPCVATTHQHTKKIDGSEAFEGNQVIAKDEHIFYGITISYEVKTDAVRK